MEYYYSVIIHYIICDAGEIDWISFWMDVERIRQIDDDVTAHFCTCLYQLYELGSVEYTTELLPLSARRRPKNFERVRKKIECRQPLRHLLGVVLLFIL